MTCSYFAGIDAGGTQFKCIIATGPDNIVAERKVDVRTPESTLNQCAQFFNDHLKSYGPYQALGIASFGPIDLDKQSTTFGHITTTPKPGWANTAIVDYFKYALNIPTPIAFDTDVNGALLAETHWGAAQGIDSAVYVTVGTGVGVGAMCDGHLIHGAMHPEAGHMLLPKKPNDSFTGVCPFHNNCLEGLTSGPALAKRLGFDAEKVSDDHPVWDIQSYYLGAMCVNLALCYSPKRIILGGGVMVRTGLIKAIRNQFTTQLNGYLAHQACPDIVPAALGQRAGALGAIALAQGKTNTQTRPKHA